MTFALPWALWGLAAIPVLIWLDRRRRRPRLRPWPSLALWRTVQEGEEPIRRRAFDRLLLLECAAALLLTLAAGDPEWVTSAARRKVVVLFDRAPYMEAKHGADRTVWQASFEEWERLRAALASMDEIVEYTSYRDLTFQAAALPDADLRVVVTDRAHVEGPGLVVLGRTAEGPNTGIDALHVKGNELWFSLATDGEVRPVPVAVDGKRLEVMPGRGVTVPMGENGSEIEILEQDCFAADNTARVSRVRLRARDDTGSKFVRTALFHAGLPAVEEQRNPDLVIAAASGDVVAEFVRGADCVAPLGPFEGLVLDDCVWRGVRSVGGHAILTWQRHPIATWLVPARDPVMGTLVLGMPVDRDWDEHGTLALLIENAKRERAEIDGPLVGEGHASWTRFVSTKGIDRSWDGTLPPPSTHGRVATSLRLSFGLLAAAVLALYGFRLARP